MRPRSRTDNTNGIPDYVETVDTTLENVWSTEVGAMGYRAPKSDANSPHHGPDSKLDVYIANIGNKGLYGYCTTDDPHTTKPSYRYWDMSAYCVLDDDYAPAQFPPPYANGLAALQVTAAHEFFHAVQFAYDYSEDSWFMEGTAAWMEDEVYDAVNDNRQYLSRSALAKPSVPVDRGNGFYQYGAWIFWRYLTESFDPDLVRETWVYADGSAVGSTSTP